MVGFAYSGYIDLKWQLLIVVSCIIDTALQIFVDEFVAFVIEFGSYWLAVEFVPFAVEFIALHLNLSCLHKQLH